MTSLNSKIDCYFLILPGILPLDFAGPLQVLLTANEQRSLYRVHYIGPQNLVAMKGGLELANIKSLPALLPPGSRLVIPGLTKTQDYLISDIGISVNRWLRQQRQVDDLSIATICSGALIAAKAGWLVNKNCTTHHDLIQSLAQIEPSASVADNRLFVNDGNIWTSAGISSGLDLFLAMLQQDSDAAFTAAVAREMVIFLRRSGDDPQFSPWLSGRNHLQGRIHQVQDIISRNPQQNYSIEELAQKVNMSPRNLTRQFRKFTTQSIQGYREKIKIAQAEKLLTETRANMDLIAEQCGFQSSRSFRRAWLRYHQLSPAKFRQSFLSN